MKNKGIALITLIIIITIIILSVAIGCIVIINNNNNNTKNEKTTQDKNEVINIDNQKALIYNDTKNFEYEEIDGGVAITKFKNYDNIEYNKIIIPSMIDGKKVVAIGRRFTDDRVMQSAIGNCEVVISSTVKFIGPWSFSNSNGIIKVSGGENVEAIYGKAFYKSKNLSEITFLDQVDWFSDSAFSNTPLNQSALELRKTLNMIDTLELDETFDHHKVNNKIGPYEYKEIEDGVAITHFRNAGSDNYSKIILPSKLDGKKVVGIGMMDGTASMCFDLGTKKCEVVIPDTVKYIGKNAFAATDGLAKVSGGDNVIKIGEEAFSMCKKLEEITFLKNVQSVANDAFSGCGLFKNNN